MHYQSRDHDMKSKTVFGKVFAYIKLYLKEEFDWKYFVFTLLFMSVGIFWFYDYNFQTEIELSTDLGLTLRQQVGSYLLVALLGFTIYACWTSLKKHRDPANPKKAIYSLQALSGLATIVLILLGAYVIYSIDGLKAYRDSERWNYNIIYYYGFLYLGVFSIAYTAYAAISGKTQFLRSGKFWFLLVFGVFVFTLRSVSHVTLWDMRDLFSSFTYRDYWFRLTNMLTRMILTMLPLAIYWYFVDRKDRPLYGFTFKGYDTKPYLTMLALMLPLIAIASLLPDFQMSYPRAGKYGLQYFDLMNIADVKYFGLFELIYGLDFVTIEFFFRGFLIYGFLRLVGPGAILAMACFYCFIHFGKPLGETISSYWGGTLLGILAYYSGSIIGGIIVHMGIAWLMELGAVLGKIYNN